MQAGADRFSVNGSNGRIKVGTTGDTFPLNARFALTTDQAEHGMAFQNTATNVGASMLIVEAPNSATGDTIMTRISATIDPIFRIWANGEITAVTTGVTNLGKFTVKSDSATTTSHIFRALDNSSNVRFYVRHDGNIGIGTAIPGTKLHMSSGTLTVDGTGGTMTIAGAGSPVTLSTWAATYGSGSAFVCINDSGVLFVSEAVCP